MSEAMLALVRRVEFLEGQVAAREAHIEQLIAERDIAARPALSDETLRELATELEARAAEHRAFVGMPCQCESSWHADEVQGWADRLRAVLARPQAGEPTVCPGEDMHPLIEYGQHKNGCEAWPIFTGHFQQGSHIGSCTCGLDAAIAALRARPALSDETLRAMAKDYAVKNGLGVAAEWRLRIFARAVLARQQEER